MDEEQEKIELLKWIVSESPEGSILEVNGFYSSNISKNSFEKLFGQDNESLRNQSSKFLIPLNKNIKAIFLEILQIEKAQLIHDLDHFAIRKNDNLIATAYDKMELVNLSTYSFPKKDFEEESIEVVFLDSLDDQFFSE